MQDGITHFLRPLLVVAVADGAVLDVAICQLLEVDAVALTLGLQLVHHVDGSAHVVSVRLHRLEQLVRHSHDVA